MIGKAPRKKTAKKPSSQKRTGKAVAKPKNGSKYLGTGAAGKAAAAIKAAKARRLKALKELG